MCAIACHHRLTNGHTQSIDAPFKRLHTLSHG
jgi:hypothetical protein